MAKRLIAITLILILFVSAVPAYSDGETSEGKLLVDYGNGDTYWYAIPADVSTVKDAITRTLDANGISYTFADTEIGPVTDSVNGISSVTIGSSSASKQKCEWRLYSWNGVVWETEPGNVDKEYLGSDLALGYYPMDTIAPASNPDYETVWSSYRGNSSSDGVSTSYGPDSVAKPLEWYNTYAGAVDCTILYADGLLYHTVSGVYGSVGMDSLAWLYCLDTVNKEVAWSLSYSNSGNIEIVTPVIVGDMIILFSGNWHVYCLDRFTGEALAELVPEGTEPDKCSRLKVTEYKTYRNDSPVVTDRTHVSAGPTNAVYDSGALYFGTSDGVMRCYSVDRDNGFTELWTNIPDDGERGCFYYYPPCITESDGKKVVLHGNCAGSLICCDAATGEKIWSVKMTDSAGNNVGAVTSISVCSGNRAIVCFTDGGMTAGSGGILLIDISDGSTVWKKYYLGNKPVVYGDRFYIYISYTTGGTHTITDHDTGAEKELVSGYYSLWVDDCSLCWVQDTEAVCGGGTVYCDGRIYGMDYSPGSEGSLGGWVWCMDSDTGTVVWKAKVSPYGGAAYSMCTPTVVDGKVIVGNDYGAVYIISETPGIERGSSSQINYESQGLAHWSWLALAGVTALVSLIAVVLYRRT